MRNDKTTVRLLLVDDERSFLEAVAPALSRRGISVRTALNGEEALALLERESSDVVVLDVKMPGMNGAAVFDEIHQRWPSLPVILLTGHGSIQQAFETSRQGVFEYLAKPCGMDRLAEVVRDAHLSRMDGPQAPSHPPRVLLVDDEADLLLALGPALRRRGMEVQTCTDGSAALEILDQRSLDVVVLDVRLPGLDGLQVLRWIKARWPHVEVILLSGHPSASADAAGFEELAFDFLTKPVTVETLVARIHDAIARIRGREAAAAAPPA